ncbi:NUDIX domain-containing protein [Streptomyces sp. NPDC014986]|uniref:NUDIX domain-containing protein n=1 Tax=Streptomyces sp. NPDC014986 TaxID=3364934 RepID=UPI0036FE92A1
MLTALDRPVDVTARTTLPGHVTCSAVIVDRQGGVLHIRHRATGLMFTPGGHIEPEDRTLLAAALREVAEEARIPPGSLCLTRQTLGSPGGLIQTYLGEERRAGTRGTYAGPGRSYEDDLADPAFSDVTERRFPVTRVWTPEDVVGYPRTASFARPALFAGRHHEFEAEALALLKAYAQGRVLTEDAEFTVLLARRPEGAA